LHIIVSLLLPTNQQTVNKIREDAEDLLEQRQPGPHKEEENLILSQKQ
jgi:hypothetical protein